MKAILSGMLESLDKHFSLMSTLGTFFKYQYIKNSIEYENIIKLVHLKIHNKQFYYNFNVASRWDDFYNVI